MVDLGSTVRMFLSFIDYYGSFLSNIFAFGLLWSSRSRLRLHCSSFHICVDWYLTEFLQYVSVQMLGTNTQFLEAERVQCSCCVFVLLK